MFMNSMKELKECICEDLARFINDEEIQCIILNGIDPDSGVVGRDLDVYVPQKKERTQLSSFLHQLADRYGARWIIHMNPIWGDRCVAIWEKDYFCFELHIISPVKLGPIVATDIFSANGKIGAYGFRFSPGLLLFKQIINKKVRAILAGRPIWEECCPGKFLLSCRGYYLHDRKALLCNNEKFIKVLLGEDNDENRKQRRYGLLFMILHYMITHPMNAISSQTKSIFRKLAAYWSPCAPVVILTTNLSVSQLQEALKQRLGDVFPKIMVSQSKHSWVFRRKMQFRQQLFVFVSCDPSESRLNGDVKLDTTSLSTLAKELELICSSIMDGMVDLNAKWSINLSPK